MSARHWAPVIFAITAFAFSTKRKVRCMTQGREMKTLIVLVSLALLGSCAAIVRNQLDERYGSADPARYQKPAAADAASVESWRKAKQVLDRRCVLCHACSDAPCQLSRSEE